MTPSARPEIASDLAVRERSVVERTRELERERAIVEEIQARLASDERALTEDLAALRAERDAIDKELGEARDRLASLDASIALEELARSAKEHELAFARNKLERDRDLTRQLERDIAQYRREIASAQKRLGDLVGDVVRIRHKLWRAASEHDRDDDG